MPAKSHRLQKIDLTTIINSENSVIDLRLDQFKSTTRAFLQTVVAFKNQAINDEVDARAAYDTQKKSIDERSQALETETNRCKVTELELAEELARETEERRDAEVSVSKLKRDLASLKDKVAALDSEIEQYRAIAEDLERDRRRERDTLLSHATAVMPEIDILEKASACIIEGLPSDRLLVRLWCIDIAQPQREFTFVVDVSTARYKVVTSSPPLPTLPVLVDMLSSSEDIYLFIMQIRQAFVKLVNP